MVFRNRHDAGQRLGAALARRGLGDRPVTVLGIPRGGVPVAFEVARALGAPLDVVVVRKVGVPYQPELAMGAVGEGGIEVVDSGVLAAAGVDREEEALLARQQRRELDRRVHHLVGEHSREPLTGRTAVVVDDGIATGSTARAACLVARARGASTVVLAVPVGPRSAAAEMRDVADEVICLETPEPFMAVGQWYQDFSPTADGEVLALLHLAATADGGGSAAAGTPPSEPVPAGADTGGPHPGGGDAADPPPCDTDVEVDGGPVRLAGHLTVPAPAGGLVVFAHGSGSSRFSPRNRAVAAALNQVGLGTLLLDLLTPAEETDRGMVFDIDLLAGRLAAAVRWALARPEATGLSVGLFGASTGAAAALAAAADPGLPVGAVVSRGGRPDLAGPWLGRVQAPTLLIVGGADELVLRLNRQAEAELRCERRLVVVPGATHLFEEPGALQQVAGLAADWFVDHLAPVGGTVRR